MARPLGHREGRRLQLFIDPDECIDCGACLPESPAEAIFHEQDVPVSCQEDVARNARFFAP